MKNCPTPSRSDIPPDNLAARLIDEEVRGPVFGYYVAAYTVGTERGYYAYAKVCREQPSAVWNAPDAFLKFSVGPVGDAAIAKEAVFRAAYRRLECQPWTHATVPIGHSKI
jgi:hypothetical protein